MTLGTGILGLPYDSRNRYFGFHGLKTLWLWESIFWVPQIKGHVALGTSILGFMEE